MSRTCIVCAVFLCLTVPLFGAGVSVLPGHFGFGLSNSSGSADTLVDMCPDIDYRYQYLVGDVTGSNWKNWSDPQPEGSFAVYYLNESETEGVIPVFTYYMIVQSSPNAGDEDYTSKITNTATMNAYYENWKLLMQKCGDFGKTVIVHHEPDLWGYIQMNHGTDPSGCAAAVASSGFSGASGLPNDARGFAQLLVRIRDTYAPNVVLAWHVSSWATGFDITVNMVDPSEKGNEVAQFYSALNAPFDLLFGDPSDRDSGYDEIINGMSGVWWSDDTFNRYRQYLKAISSTTGLKAMLWQVPCGNTLYLSCDNTWNHYQDNRPQYFLLEANQHHIREYAQAGVIGILFGRGTDGCTSPFDSMGDGVTNPASVNGTYLTSVHADDDGGFLRISINSYYSTGMVNWKSSGQGGGCAHGSGEQTFILYTCAAVLLFLFCRSSKHHE